jgi:hypothetical protein
MSAESQACSFRVLKPKVLAAVCMAKQTDLGELKSKALAPFCFDNFSPLAPITNGVCMY